MTSIDQIDADAGTWTKLPAVIVSEPVFRFRLANTMLRVLKNVGIYNSVLR